MLANDYFESELNISYILTARKQQDPLENFFGQVRGHNGFNRNPSLQEFNNMMGRTMSMKLLSYTLGLTNCESDEAEYIYHAVIAASETADIEMNATILLCLHKMLYWKRQRIQLKI